MSKTQFRLAARTDAAGKYNAEAPLEGNEDNMYVDSDLSNNAQGEFMADQVVDLSDKGCLMVVADGMGGMNAGEVASDIAIKTVTSYFSPERMAETSFRDSRARCKYLEQVVEAADEAIKNDARSDKEHEGMGSTIILAWLCDDEICLTWCGDSRAYLFRPGKGFWQVSKDHSYVQGLVDDGKITIDEAFDHPYGNIITRSLGDPEKRAKADSKVFPVFEGDIFMLCSDGLSGVLRDHKTYDPDGQRIDTENLEDIIDANRHSMTDCRDALFAAAERNDWYDNVTAIVCEIVSGKPLPANLNEPPVSYPTPKVAHPEPLPGSDGEIINPNVPARKKHLPLIIALAVVLLAGGGFLIWWLTQRSSGQQADQKLFDRCVTANDYRTYLALYPDGKNAEFAKTKLAELVTDSIENATLVANPNINVANNSSTNTKKGEQTNNSGKAKENGKDTSKGKKEPNTEPEKKTDSMPAQSLNEMLRQEGSRKTGNDSLKPINPELNKKNPNMTPADEKNANSNLKESSKSNSGLSGAGNTQEEKDYNTIRPLINNNTVTLSDCKKYLKSHGPNENKEHWSHVAQKFAFLYKEKVKKCKTSGEVQAIIDNHDSEVKVLTIKGWNQYDTQLKEFAVAWKNKLVEKEKNAPSGSVGRLESGIKAPSHPQ